MGRSTTRKAVRKLYPACKNCPKNLNGYGICKNGFENYFYRKSKNNGCPKCNTSFSNMSC